MHTIREAHPQIKTYESLSMADLSFAKTRSVPNSGLYTVGRRGELTVITLMWLCLYSTASFLCVIIFSPTDCKKRGQGSLVFVVGGGVFFEQNLFSAIAY